VSDQDLLIPASQPDSVPPNARTRRGRVQMIFLLLACASPVIASYLAYYVFKPEGNKTNYGVLVNPPQPINPNWLAIPTKGKWTLLVSRSANECRKGNDACVQLLYLMRQLRVAMGKEAPRLQLVWVVSDGKPVDPDLAKAYDQTNAGFMIVNAPLEDQAVAWRAWLGKENAASQIQLIDPSGEKMMFFPATGDAKDFVRMRKDLEKLLRLNRKGEKAQ